MAGMGPPRQEGRACPTPGVSTFSDENSTLGGLLYVDWFAVKPEGRKIIAHGVSRVEQRVRDTQPRNGA